MKKLFLLTCFFFWVPLSVPSYVGAQENPPVFASSTPLPPPVNTQSTAAQPPNSDSPTSFEQFFHLDEINNLIHLGDASPITIVVRLINVALSFLGIIFVIIVLYTGLLFLFSFGKEERLAQAKKAFFNALVGLLIILSSYSIVNFVLSAFEPPNTSTPDPLLDGG